MSRSKCTWGAGGSAAVGERPRRPWTPPRALQRQRAAALAAARQSPPRAHLAPLPVLKYQLHAALAGTAPSADGAYGWLRVQAPLTGRFQPQAAFTGF